MADRRRPRIVVTRRLPDPTEARLGELFEVVLNHADRRFSRAELADALAGADVVVPTLSDPLDAELLAMPGLRTRLIANFGAGVDHIDLAAARAAGIVVTNTPGVLSEDSADLAMALILAVPRRIALGERILREGRWTGWEPCAMLGRRIAGKRLAILGMGRVGRAIARRAQAFGLEVHYHNRRRLPPEVERENGATWAPTLEALLPRADILSINCPHTPATHHLLDDARLRLLPPHAYLINVARGEIVDEAALIDALENGRLAGAGLDVWAHAPAADPRLLGREDVLLLPHMGSATIEARIATGERVIANIRSWSDGHRPPDQVLEGWA